MKASLFLTVTLCACAAPTPDEGAPKAEGDSGSDTRPDTAAGPAPCVATGFDPSGFDYHLPARVYWSWPGTSDDGDSWNDERWALYDLTQDGYADLVVTFAQFHSEATSSGWEVYPGGPTGFSDTALGYALPTIEGERWDDNAAFGAFEGSAARYCDDGERAWYMWHTMDLTGDGRLDLFLSYLGCDELAAETWALYEGGQSGFAAAPTPYGLPADEDMWQGGTGGESNHRCAASGRNETFYWDTLDLTGDGRPDFVVPYDACDASIGATEWRIYPGETGGFSASPLYLGLPAAQGTAWRDDLPWPYTSSTTYRTCDNGTRSAALTWTLADLVDDARLDLVVTYDACDPTIGATQWAVHAGSEAGYAATPEHFYLPTIEGSGWEDGVPFPTLEGSSEHLCASGATGTSGWSVRDLTNDGTADLVLTSDGCDATLGSDHWAVYEQGDAGFSEPPRLWQLPSSARTFPTVQDTTRRDCEPGGSGDYAWDTTDLNGDGAADLVVTLDECGPESLSTERWVVYFAVCAEP